MSDPSAYYGCGLAVATYDAFAGGAVAGDVAFYVECARRFGGPVLELATGTGRVLIPVAKAGCVRRHLEPGGHLVVDLFDPSLEGLARPAEAMPVREARHPITGNPIRRTVMERSNDAFRQVVHETLRIEELDGAGRVVASEVTSWALRWCLRQEMAYLFELCGFEIVAQYSDFEGSPPAYGREQLWVVAAR